MNEHAKWIEFLLLNDLQSDDEVLAELGADAPEITESARKTTAALIWLRSLPEQQVVRVPKIRKVNSAVAALAPDCASAFDAGVEALLYELRTLNPGTKIVEV